MSASTYNATAWRYASVLSFRPRAHVHPGPRNQREYLLWPAWAYRVVAPAVRERQLDVLEKAVLGLCRAGVTRAVAIGPRLHIHADLAAVVALGLQQRGLLGGDGLPTPRGIAILAEETIEEPRMVAGYVFQDPWSGALWPRFVPRLEHAEVERGGGEGAGRTRRGKATCHLILGSRGRPWRQPAFIPQPPSSASPAEPSPWEIWRAAREHRKALRRMGSRAAPGDGWSEGEDAGSSAVPERDSLMFERIGFIEEHPEKVLLTTYLYLPEGEGGDWQVCDPFGLGASPWLWRAIEQRIDDTRGLGECVERLLGRSLQGGLDDYRQRMERLRANAALVVGREIGVQARQLLAFDALVDMECARQEAEQLGPACPYERIRAILNAARRVIEATLQALARDFPLTGVWRHLYAGKQPIQDGEYIQSIYDAAAQSMGLRTPLPGALLRVKPGLVRSVADHGDTWRLRPALMATLLVARDTPAHPLRVAARLHPALIDELDEIAAMAGGTAHHGSSLLDIDAAVEAVARVYRAVAVLANTGIETSTLAPAPRQDARR